MHSDPILTIPTGRAGLVLTARTLGYIGWGRKLMSAALPHFYIVGAPKCGTTALHHYLSGHPGIFMPKKGPNFFCTDLPCVVRCRDLQSYSSLFAQAPHGTLIGETSVWYLFSQRAIREIVSLQHDAKIIVILRNPVEMARSLHAELLLGLTEDIDDFEAAWAAQEERSKGKRLPWRADRSQLLQYGDLCRLYNQAKRVADIVPPERRYFLLYEEFFANPEWHYAQLLRFLRLAPDGRTSFPVINRFKGPKNRTLHSFLRHPPVPLSSVLGAADRVKRSLNLRLGWLLGQEAQEKKPLRPAFEAELYGYFEPDIRGLESLLDRSLDIWRKKSEP